MAKKNISDIVKDYLTQVGIRKIKREELDDDFINEWQQLQDHDHLNGSQDEVYQLLHRDVATSLKAFGYVDYSFYLYCLKELYYEDFEGRVLDVGCGNGIITCFIALLNPDAMVYGIDKNKEAISIAKKIASELKLDNVFFENKEMKDAKEQYDHVISIRTVHENIGFLSSDLPYLPFEKQLASYKEIIGDYGLIFHQLLSDGGELFSIERSGYNCAYLAYLSSLGDYLCIDEDSLEKASVHEGKTLGHFVKIKALESDKRIDVLKLWLDYYRRIDDQKDLRSLCDYELSIKANKLIAGYKTVDDNGTILAKRCLYEGNNGELLLFQANNDLHQLLEYPMSRLAEGRSLLNRTRNDDLSKGYRVVEIDEQDLSTKMMWKSLFQ